MIAPEFMIESLNIMRYFKSMGVGLIGVGINFTIFNISRKIAEKMKFLPEQLGYWGSWSFGIFIASISNYILNELWTFS